MTKTTATQPPRLLFVEHAIVGALSRRAPYPLEVDYLYRMVSRGGVPTVPAYEEALTNLERNSRVRARDADGGRTCTYELLEIVE